MSYEFRPAKRENVPLLLGLAGGTGSGKTLSALRLARGIADEQVFAAIDTENGRMDHYADEFPELRITRLAAPFRPERYAEAIEAAERYLAEQKVPLGSRVVVVDSASHEWAGDGGCLDWHEDITGGDKKKGPVAWATVKRAHKKMVTQLLQVQAHVILCFRAEPKVDIVRKDGKIEFVPKRSPTGLDGWMPISEKMLPYELTASFLLMAEEPGIPRKIKLEEQLKPFVRLDAVLDEETGQLLAEWARGGKSAVKPAGETGRVGFSAEAFNKKVDEAGISVERAKEIGRAVLPGKVPSRLTNAERGQWWQAIEKELTPA
jgi:hypothetical protein